MIVNGLTSHCASCVLSSSFSGMWMTWPNSTHLICFLCPFFSSFFFFLFSCLVLFLLRLTFRISVGYRASFLFLRSLSSYCHITSYYSLFYQSTLCVHLSFIALAHRPILLQYLLIILVPPLWIGSFVASLIRLHVFNSCIMHRCLGHSHSVYLSIINAFVTNILYY